MDRTNLASWDVWLILQTASEVLLSTRLELSRLHNIPDFTKHLLLNYFRWGKNSVFLFSKFGGIFHHMRTLSLGTRELIMKFIAISSSTPNFLTWPQLIWLDFFFDSRQKLHHFTGSYHAVHMELLLRGQRKTKLFQLWRLSGKSSKLSAWVQHSTLDTHIASVRHERHK